MIDLGESAELDAILSDQYNGSTRVAMNVLRFFQRPSIMRDPDVVRLIKVVIAKRSDMAVLSNLGKVALAMLDFGIEPDVLWQALSSDLEYSASTAALIGAMAFRYPGSFVSISNSEQLFLFFKDSKTRVKVAYLLESQPGGEGRLLYRALLKLGLKSRLVRDGELASLKGVDYFVVGSDTVLSGGFFNKIGTRAVAEIASDSSKPLYVLTHKWKVASKDSPQRPADPVFEFIPNSLVTEYFTDLGPLRAGDAYSQMVRMLNSFRGPLINRGAS